MKTPHLATALLSTAALLGTGGESATEWTEMRGIIRRRGLTLNQRQKRKDRRRAFANGNRRAFR